MLKRMLSLAVVCALYVGFVCVKPASAQTHAEKPAAPAENQPQPVKPEAQPAPKPSPKDAKQIERIKRDVTNFGVATKVTVILKDKQERYGEIAQIDDDTFKVVETDMKRLLTFDYKDVKQVRFNYGGPNPFTGKRWHPRWAYIAGISVLAFFLILGHWAATVD